jgi:hypothetical protein
MIMTVLRKQYKTKYNISKDNYRMRFREEKTEAGGNPLRNCLCVSGSWIPPTEHPVETVPDVVVLEQFLLMIPSEIRVWVFGKGIRSLLQRRHVSQRSTCLHVKTNGPFPMQTQWQLLDAVGLWDNAGHVVRHNTKSSFN